MPWSPLDVSADEIRATQRLRKKARFLVDHNVHAETVPFLREDGWNAVTVDEVGLASHSDEDVLAYAQRDDRILITHDRDFLDDRRFPPHRNPGLVVVPVGAGEQVTLVRALMVLKTLIAPYRELYRQAKIVINADASVSITSRRHDTGAMHTTRYRSGANGSWQEWL
jgi:predicted nuclease of predicted toxin-antitoxin system